jgi:hypothetical protein
MLKSNRTAELIIYLGQQWSQRGFCPDREIVFRSTEHSVPGRNRPEPVRGGPNDQLIRASVCFGQSTATVLCSSITGDDLQT